MSHFAKSLLMIIIAIDAGMLMLSFEDKTGEISRAMAGMETPTGAATGIGRAGREGMRTITGAAAGMEKITGATAGMEGVTG